VTSTPASAFGEALRRKREDAGLSLRRLAVLVSYSPGWMSRVENGLANPTLQMAQLCDRHLSAGNELTALARCLLAEGPGAPPPARIAPQLPRGMGDLIGRGHDLRFLDRRLSDSAGSGDGMLVSVEGPVGIGKSALAVHWAHSVGGLFPEGVLFADLHGHSSGMSPLSPNTVLEAFLAALGIGAEAMPSGVARRAALFQTLTAGRRILIVLDNAANSAQVQALLPSRSGCAVVITSRRRLTGLAVRDDAAVLSLRPLSESDAVDVLHSFVGTGGEGGQGTSRIAARLCGHVPLALRVAGYRLATSRSPSGLVRDLVDPVTRLDLLSDADDSSVSVRAALERSYLDLDAAAARMFRLLGLTPAGLSAAAAAVLSGQPQRQAQRALDSLLDLHLAGLDGGDYRLGELEGAFAAEKLAIGESAAERAAAVQRLALWSSRRSSAFQRAPVADTASAYLLLEGSNRTTLSARTAVVHGG
jgi:Helix-turn-helix domain/NB-ARC domain